MQSNKKNMRLWVKALRSGEFEQGRTRLTLCNEDGTLSYCCLGVACETAMMVGVPLVVSVMESTVYDEGWLMYDDEAELLPHAVSEWLGIDDDNILLRKDGLLATIANDSCLWTFNEIADAVEEYYDLLTPMQKVGKFLQRLLSVTPVWATLWDAGEASCSMKSIRQTR